MKCRGKAVLAAMTLLIATTLLLEQHASAHLDDNLRGVPPSPPAEWNYHSISADESRQWIEEGIIFAAWAAQWKGEGFNARAAGRWHKIANVYTAGDFLRNGFGPEEAREWMDNGIRSGKRAAEYLAIGLDAKEAGTFWERGLYPDEVREWRNAGFDAQATLEWRYGPKMSEFYLTRDTRYSQEVYDVNFAKEWRTAGFAPDDAHRAKTYQLKLAEAIEWKKAGFPFREMVLWKDSGFNLEDAAALKSAGLSAREADLRQYDASAQEDEIAELFADITVREDGTLEIIEMVTVMDRPGGDFPEGYYQSAPSGECGLSSSRSTFISTPLQVRSVEVDGRPAEYALSGSALHIRKNGGPLPEGEHRIILVYTTDRMVRDEPHHDELCFVIAGPVRKGNYLRNAAATVRLPKGGHVIFAGGNAGLRDRKDFLSETEETGAGDIVRYTVTRPLRQNMSFTIDLGFVKGYARPSWRQQYVQLDRESKRFLSSLAIFLSGIAVACLYYGVAWHKVGRDPEARAAGITAFSPPGDVGPAAMRAFLTKGRTDHLSAAAELIAFAARGFIRIFEAKGIYRIERTDAGLDQLQDRERVFLDLLFNEHKEILLAGRSTKRPLSRAYRHLNVSLKSEYRAQTETNTRYLWPGIGVSVLFLAASLAVIDKSELIDRGDAVPVLAAYGAALAAGYGSVLLLFRRLLRRPAKEQVDLLERLRAYAGFLKRNFADPGARTHLPPFLQEHLAYAIAAGIDVRDLLLRSGEATWYTGASGGFACGDFIVTVKRSL